MKAGTYKLTKDFTSPEADRRYGHDWRKQKIIPANTVVSVRESTHHPGLFEAWAGSWIINSVSSGTPEWQPFFALLELLEDTPRRLLTREGETHWALPLLDILYGQGKFTLEDLREAKRIYLGTEDDRVP